MIEPKYRSAIFWDVDINKLDFNANKNFIIRRVFERGNWNEVLQTVVFYGDSTTINALVNAEYLMEVAIDIAYLLFKIKHNEFKCYTKKQYHPN